MIRSHHVHVMPSQRELEAALDFRNRLTIEARAAVPQAHGIKLMLVFIENRTSYRTSSN